nr:CBS domain-containing protein [Bacteroidota bacterium]
MNAGELVSDSIFPLHTPDKVSMAINWMEEYHVSHLPVVENLNYLGIVSETMLLEIEDTGLPVGNYCIALAKPFITENEHYFNSLSVMSGLRLSVLPVLNNRNEYIGVITRETLIKCMAETLSLQNPGGIIVVELNENDLNLSEIARIIEAHDTKILNSSINSNFDSTKIELTLKLNRINIEPVIQSLIRFQYNIKAYYGENEKDEDLLRERYDSLMNFLKI